MYLLVLSLRQVQRQQLQLHSLKPAQYQPSLHSDAECCTTHNCCIGTKVDRALQACPGCSLDHEVGPTSSTGPPCTAPHHTRSCGVHPQLCCSEAVFSATLCSPKGATFGSALNVYAQSFPFTERFVSLLQAVLPSLVDERHQSSTKNDSTRRKTVLQVNVSFRTCSKPIISHTMKQACRN